MAEEQKHWTQEDIDRMQEQVYELNTKIEEAKVSILREKVGYLDEYFKRELTGKVIMSEHPWSDGDSKYIFIKFVKVDIDYSYARTLYVSGVSLDIDCNKIGVGEDSIRMELDDDGRPKGVLFGADTESDGGEYVHYRIVDPDELAKAKGVVRKQIEHALELRNKAHAEQGKDAVEKFLRDFRKERKELEARASGATVEAPGDEETVDIP